MSKKKESLTKAHFNCVAKTRYRNERVATIRAKQIGKRRGVELWVYKCPECKGWHLTSRVSNRPVVDDFEVIA
ncbi:hypothetical protein [Castellaniella caeni]|uniref:hypothetical protein n=1 Tax=Castellaniella caeni TaxID=266123 RepID=UPI000C9F760B|nr:hypothetical protein [Castellaniella caeni]